MFGSIWLFTSATPTRGLNAGPRRDGNTSLSSAAWQWPKEENDGENDSFKITYQVTMALQPTCIYTTIKSTITTNMFIYIWQKLKYSTLLSKTSSRCTAGPSSVSHLRSANPVHQIDSLLAHSTSARCRPKDSLGATGTCFLLDGLFVGLGFLFNTFVIFFGAFWFCWATEVQLKHQKHPSTSRNDIEE